jgi:polar amino acid transport system substrate-binding protein
MKKWFAAAVILLCFATSSGAAERERLLFLTQDFPPFTYAVDGVPSGPGVEIVKTVCTEQGVDCDVRILPWPRAQMLLRRGQADALFFIGKTYERTRWMRFSSAVVRTEYGFFKRKDSPLAMQESGPQALKGKVVGVYGPSNTSNTLDLLCRELDGDFFIDMTPDDEEAFKKLAWGRIDAVFSNRDVGVALMGKLHLGNLEYAAKYEDVDYYIGYTRSPERAVTVDRFDRALGAMIESGRVEAILKRFFLQ